MRLKEITYFQASIIFFIFTYLPFFKQTSLLLNILLVLNILLCILQEKRKRKIPRLIVTGLFLSGLALIYQNYQTLWGLEPGVALLSLMGSLKLFEMRRRRDFFLSLLISELGLVGHVLTVDDLYMVIFVFIATLLLFGLLFHFQMGNEKWSKTRRKIFIKIFIFSLPVATILFFIFPRLPLGNLFFNTIKKENYTGFSETLRPGELAEVVNDNVSYFRAIFFKNKTPTYFELYWRGAVLSQTDGFKWTHIKTPGGSQERVLGPAKYEYEVTYDKFMNSPLFLLDNSMNLKLLGHGHPKRMGGGTIKFYPYSNQKTSYRAQTGRPQATRLSEKVRQHFLQLPPSSVAPRFFSWAGRQNEKKKENELSLRKAAALFQSYLKREEFTYTLKPGFINGKNPLDRFFFDIKLGFCEHYSAAFALYLRIIGIPSRVVVGFHGGEYNPLGQYYLVRGVDAHAWVEAWDQQKGWMRFDPTGWISPDRIRYGAQSYFAQEEVRRGISMDVYLEEKNGEFWQGLLFALDMFYYEANREFVGFDLDRQRGLFKFLGKERSRWSWKLLALCVGALFLLLAPFFFYLRGAMLPAKGVSRSYLKLRKKLEKGGMPISEQQGPKLLQERALKYFPGQSESLSKVFSLYMQAVYGDGAKEAASREFCLLVKRINLPKTNKRMYQKRS